MWRNFYALKELEEKRRNVSFVERFVQKGRGDIESVHTRETMLSARKRAYTYRDA